MSTERWLSLVLIFDTKLSAIENTRSLGTELGFIVLSASNNKSKLLVLLCVASNNENSALSYFGLVMFSTGSSRNLLIKFSMTPFKKALL